MQKNLSIGVFCLWTAVLVAATLFLAPSWGLMDDYQNLDDAFHISHSAAPIQTWAKVTWDNTLSWGIFRPVYTLWVSFIYSVFAHAPTGAYIFIILMNMGALLVWGRIFYQLYKPGRDNFYPSVYLFPLSCFLFTPFWNIFMYISVQEKFVVLFGGLSVLFFSRSYDTGETKHIGAALLFFILGILGKPTCMALAVAYLAFSLLDLGLFKIRPAISRIYLIILALFSLAYALFTFKIQIKGVYTATYGHNFTPGTLMLKFLAANSIIKLLYLAAAAMAAFIISKFISGKGKGRELSLLLPMSLLGFLVLLLPWGYQSYLLSDLAPFVLGLFFPVYIWLMTRSPLSRMITNALLLILLLVVLTGSILPRISKMANIAQAERFLISQGAPEDRYFFPPPYLESAYALNGFTHKDIVFLKDGNLGPNLLGGNGHNYLIENDQCSAVHLNGVSVKEKVYANPTWQIFRLSPQAGMEGDFQVEFQHNWVQQIKTVVRNL